MSKPVALTAQVAALDTILNHATPGQLRRAGIVVRDGQGEHLLEQIKAARLTLAWVERNADRIKSLAAE